MRSKRSILRSKTLARHAVTVSFVASLGLLGPLSAATATARPIAGDEKIIEQFQESPTARYFIFFRERADLSPAYEMDWNERGRFVMRELRRVADRAQRRVRDYLARSGTEFESFWIDNVIAVASSDLATFMGLQQFEEIASLRADPEMRLIEPEETNEAGSQVFTVEPNLEHVNAPEAWALGFEGQGMVVANIDTGVRYTHEALVDSYRGNQGDTFDHNHNWWDPSGGTATPTDGNRHGSHTMGTMVGDDGGTNQIGIAPGARWIACRGCPTSGCPANDLLECAQFMAAPWNLGGENPDPDLRPHVVNNSWGNCRQFYDDWYQGVVDSWHAAGIVPVFSNGNTSNCGYPSDPPCNTVGNPGRYGNVLGVGSTGTSDGQYATHSNKGPTDDPWDDNPLGFPTIKPNLAAPGVAIRSSVNNSDSAYQLFTGTSMSAPHVAGLVALLWQAAPCLIGDYVATAEILMAESTPIPYDSQCGGEGPDNEPNHATGWGEIDALAIVTAGFAACGAQTIDGVVARSDTSAPLHGARVDAVGSVIMSTTTEPDGSYEIRVLSGTYEVTASITGFRTETVSGVVVPEGESVTVDFSLDPLPVADVSPVALLLEALPGGSDAGTLNVGNIGNADLVWSLATDVPESAGSRSGGRNETGRHGTDGSPRPATGLVAAGIRGRTSRSHDPGLDESLAIPDFEVVPPAEGGESVVFALPAGLASRGRVVGFSFAGNASGIGDNGSLASDTCKLMQAPDGTPYGVGGYNGLLEGCAETDWDFQGNVSGEDGAYESEHDDAFDPPLGDLGEWTLRFSNDWNEASAATIAWSDVTVILHKEPLPVCDDVTEVGWLSADPPSGITSSGSVAPVSVVADAAGLAPGAHEAALCVATNDSEAPVVSVPVTLVVTGDGGFTATALEVDRDVAESDGNGVLEPGELVDVAPAWRNDREEPWDVTGTASGFEGPHGADYVLAIDDAHYGTLVPGQTASCLETGTCYRLGVNDLTMRPATHWEATFDETLPDDTTKTWDLHIGDSFVDVPPSNIFYPFVETLLHQGVTGGCTDTEYCPTAGNTRGQMAVFLLKAVEEDPDYAPPTCVEGGERFPDMPFDSIFCPWIEELAERGITSGCGGGNYCPNDTVTRSQMSVFLLRALEGDGYTPPECSGEFSDVGCPSGFADWIEELAALGITGGCGAEPPMYCPADPVTRGQMATFVTRTFGLTLYGP